MGKLGERDTGPLCTIYATICDSIIISRKRLKKGEEGRLRLPDFKNTYMYMCMYVCPIPLLKNR